MKVVINVCFGGFRLSDQALQAYAARKGLCASEVSRYDPGPRHDPDIVEVVETLGQAAGGPDSEFKVVEIPDNVNYTIEDYDGWEHIAEVHRTWS